jgi:hypothetical protein
MFVGLTGGDLGEALAWLWRALARLAEPVLRFGRRRHGADGGGGNGDDSAPSSRVTLAERAFPELRFSALLFSRVYWGLVAFLFLWLITTALTYWDIAMGNSILQRIEQLDMDKTTILQANPALSACLEPDHQPSITSGGVTVSCNRLERIDQGEDRAREDLAKYSRCRGVILWMFFRCWPSGNSIGRDVMPPARSLPHASERTHASQTSEPAAKGTKPPSHAEPTPARAVLAGEPARPDATCDASQNAALNDRADGGSGSQPANDAARQPEETRCPAEKPSPCGGRQDVVRTCPPRSPGHDPKAASGSGRSTAARTSPPMPLPVTVIAIQQNNLGGQTPKPPGTTDGPKPPGTTEGPKPPGTTDGAKPPGTTDGAKPPGTTDGAKPRGTTDGLKPPGTTDGPKPPGSPPAKTAPQDRPTADQAAQSVASILSVLGNNGLPVLLGVLGNMIAALRTIQSKVQDSLLTPRDFVATLMGLPIGAAAGLAVGLFLNPSSAPVSGAAGLTGGLNLTASGLGFLAGYGSNRFFGFLSDVLDRVFSFASPRNSPAGGQATGGS